MPNEKLERDPAKEAERFVADFDDLIIEEPEEEQPEPPVKGE